MNTGKAQVVMLLVAMLGVSGAALAEKPDSASKNNKHHEVDKRAHYFTDAQIITIRDYYGKHKGAGGCPPGLAKKNNGCLPPGQAKKWHRGDTLPPGVVLYDLPGALLTQIGATPHGQKVVRVDEDILLISIATGIILDVLEIQ